ncbi:hypothetical protein PLESTM_001478700 [Pleodorina starrii]|nr:hypothetical protein PLESTM_001478700 [Pleodorina starrii]
MARAGVSRQPGGWILIPRVTTSSGFGPLLLRTKLPDTVRVDLIRASRIGSFLVGGVLSTSALTQASASLTWAVYRSSSVLQSTYHIQMLSMSALLASPGVNATYRRIARELRWSVLSIQGNIPPLDRGLSNPKEVDMAIGAKRTLGLAALHQISLGTSTAANTAAVQQKGATAADDAAGLEAPSSSTTVTEAVESLLAASTTLPQRDNAGRTLASKAVVAMTTESEEPLIRPVVGLPLMPADEPGADSRDALIAWLRSASQFAAASKDDNSTNGSGANSGGIFGSGVFGITRRIPTSLYVIGGGAAGDHGSDVVALDANGRLLDTNAGWATREAPPPPLLPTDLQGGDGNAVAVTTRTFWVDEQDLLFTLCTATALMAATMLVHALLVLLYKRCIGPKLPAALQVPRVEVGVAGPLLVALTFYAFLALGAPDVNKLNYRQTMLATIVLWILVVPALVLLWWLTVCRWYLEETVRQGKAWYLEETLTSCSVRDSIAAMPVPPVASAVISCSVRDSIAVMPVPVASAVIKCSVRDSIAVMPVPVASAVIKCSVRDSIAVMPVPVPSAGINCRVRNSIPAMSVPPVASAGINCRVRDSIAAMSVPPVASAVISYSVRDSIAAMSVPPVASAVISSCSVQDSIAVMPPVRVASAVISCSAWDSIAVMPVPLASPMLISCSLWDPVAANIPVPAVASLRSAA